MLLLSKGGTIKVPDEQVPVAVVTVGLGLGALVGIFLVPWLYRTVILNDWQLKWYDIWKGLFLLHRGPVPANPEESSIHADRPHLLSIHRHSRQSSYDTEMGRVKEEVTELIPEVKPYKSMIGPKPDGP